MSLLCMVDPITGNTTEGMKSKSQNMYPVIGVILIKLAKLFGLEDIYLLNFMGNFCFYYPFSFLMCTFLNEWLQSSFKML